jgi:hypothetical protein
MKIVVRTAQILTAIAVGVLPLHGSPSINQCVESQYDSSGTATDKHQCYWGLNEDRTCEGTCHKYVTSGNTSDCKTCASSGARFWVSCDNSALPSTSLAGTSYHADCKGDLNCNCDSNWVFDGVGNVPCYHATGDSCWF